MRENFVMYSVAGDLKWWVGRVPERRYLVEDYDGRVLKESYEEKM